MENIFDDQQKVEDSHLIQLARRLVFDLAKGKCETEEEIL